MRNGTMLAVATTAAGAAIALMVRRRGGSPEITRATEEPRIHPVTRKMATMPESRIVRVRDIPRDLIDRQETGAQTSKRVQRLLKLRSHVDREAWNTLGTGPMGSYPSPTITDWPDRCMLLVTIGIAFEDFPEVLERAIDDPDGTSAHASLLYRTTQAYEHLAAARVPARWNHPFVDASWRKLCDAVAEIIGQEPHYGTPLPDPRMPPQPSANR